MEKCPLSFFITNPQLCLSSPIFWGSRRNRSTAVLSNQRPEPQRHLAQPESRTWTKFIPKYYSRSRILIAYLRPGKAGALCLREPMHLSKCSRSPDNAWDQLDPAVPSGRGSLSLARDMLCSSLLCSTLYDPLPQHGQGQNVTLESRGRLQ